MSSSGTAIILLHCRALCCAACSHWPSSRWPDRRRGGLCHATAWRSFGAESGSTCHDSGQSPLPIVCRSEDVCLPVRLPAPREASPCDLQEEEEGQAPKILATTTITTITTTTTTTRKAAAMDAQQERSLALVPSKPPERRLLSQEAFKAKLFLSLCGGFLVHRSQKPELWFNQFGQGNMHLRMKTEDHSTLALRSHKLGHAGGSLAHRPLVNDVLRKATQVGRKP
ncbi:unnamed protein product [Polarella glacialis]|uniref:Uncharacterized protein n=1 Tax=Polarella glacialis TaxID=89957 RepID=A0A813DKL6_POLGL|nr:unnamed protein product [Polarella glacialis]